MVRKGKKKKQAGAESTSQDASTSEQQKQQQQVSQGQPQQPAQSTQQQESQSPPPQQQQPAWPRQRGPQSVPPQQQPPAWPRQQGPQSVPPQQQPPAWPRQQVPQSVPPQQQPPAWPQQQVPQSVPPQQQPQQQPPARPQQQGPQSVPPQQQQPAWPRQQVPQSVPPQQQPPAWPRQQGAHGQPQQVVQAQQIQQEHQKPISSQQQKQLKPSIDIGAAGDQKVQPTGMQPSTSIQSPPLLTGLTLTDPFSSERTATKAKMSTAQLKAYHEMIPRRQNPGRAGTKGEKTAVFTNMFEIIFKDNFVTNAVHYDVTIKPYREESKKEVRVPKLPKGLCRIIFEEFRNKNFNKRYPAYDGNKNAYSGNNLPFGDDIRGVVSVIDNNQQRKFEIIMKKVANVDLSWIKNLRPGLAGNKDQTAIQVLDIIMRHAPESRTSNITVGKSLFWNINEEEKLGAGVALGRGGFLSGVLGWQPYLNVDISHKGFTVTQKVIAYMAEVALNNERRVRELTYDDVMRYSLKMQSFLRGLKVTYEIPGLPSSKRTYRIMDLCKDSCDSFKFSDSSSGRQYTITTYFREVKRYKIGRPDLPVLHVGNTADGGKVMLPVELCTIVGKQAINKKLDETQTAAMIKKTVAKAPDRKYRIEAAFDEIKVNNSPVMENEFHLSVNPQMKRVDARVLSAPILKYENERTAKVMRGVWYLQKFNQPKHLEDRSWTILDLSGTKDAEIKMQEFVKELRKTGSECGMRIGDSIRPYKRFYANELNKIKDFFNTHKHLKLIIVLIPNQRDVTYGNVKQITEMEIGVLTQCIKIQTIKNGSDVPASTLKNILQKINSKLNGVNHILQTIPFCLQCDYILVGADVTHPAPDSRDIPSIAAVAASRNSAFQYNVVLKLQPPKEEMILDLEAIILAQLNAYGQENRRAPKRIIYYRDGVSEGQLPQVMFHEINAIRQAIRKFNKGNIEITCVVVQKRHHVRLFPVNPKDTDDRNGNVRPGTIVDTQITHPDHIDFYLVSHASIQGTARHTKYRCIYNDSKFNEDQLEEMTYYLCHMYARCTRAVSYPAPTYYAHLGAFRGRTLIQSTNFRLDKRTNFDLKMAGSPMHFV
ncbi:PREDICTED: protein argonaute-2 isoform X2 [Wasmannia auropunctata]|uniref:protein argonaute-2 isoform X2 n=1 Tax=Wasmannia auropunctata TaxID=64793 RepID=UPI0005EE5E06|nr:PREDICTED: protein argonaute-2 isoform X2 [Wasmannia auropunctata]